MAAKERNRARIVGSLFIIAIIASLVGGILIESILTDADYLATISGNETLLTVSVLLELLNGLCVIGIAVLLFPVFKKYDEALALGYVALRLVEAIIVFVAVISPLTLIVLSREYLTASAAQAENFQVIGTAFLAMREQLVGQLTGIFFGLAALLLYYLLYQTRLVPRWLSVWGFIAVALVLAWNLLEFVGITINAGMILALPMILNEIVLAIWFIVKGFNAPAADVEPVAAVVG